MTPPSPALLLAACLALAVTPIGEADGRLTLTGPDAAVRRLAALIRPRQAAFLACLAAESDAAVARQREGFRVVRLYDVGADGWRDVPRDDPLVALEDCRRDPQRAAILAALARTTQPAPLPTAA